MPEAPRPTVAKHQPHRAHRAPLLTLIICSFLLVAFATLSHLAVQSKSPAYDEPLHSVSAWLQTHYSEFRIDPEDPALWKYWAGLGTRANDLQFPDIEPFLKWSSHDIFLEWPFVVRVLYQTPGNVENSESFINRQRMMMLIVGVALGAMIAYWGWKIGGTLAAVVSCALLAFDPNFLGHATLVKNDVPLALVMLALMYATWKLGRRINLLNLLALALLCASAINIKFSAMLLGPIIALLLLIRALLPFSWRVLRWEITSVGGRVASAAGVCIVAAIVSYFGIWACYQFRFRPAPPLDSSLNIQAQIEHTAENMLRAKDASIVTPTTQQLKTVQPTLFTRAVVTMNEHRLLPQAFLTGLLYTYQSAMTRSTYLAGQYSRTGWWYYFPFAMLVKSPLSLIAASLGSLAVGVVAFRHRAERARDGSIHESFRWAAACLAIPPAIYLLAAMRSNLNIGLRHVLPVYPFLYIGIGLAASYLWKFKPALTRLAAALLAVALAAEALAAFPNYIAFFNAAVGGPRKGLYLLGDSNLDWGQDLKLLAQWQEVNLKPKGIPLYLVYFGVADPSAYGIEYINFPGGWQFNRNFQFRTEPGVLAISATNLQGIYLSNEAREAYSKLKNREPLEVLGGTIYLYRWPPTPRAATTSSSAVTPAH